MLKPLTQMARAELEIAYKFRGKLWAFTPTITKDGIGLGIAVANEEGYVPIPRMWCYGDNYDEMSEHADVLNKEDGKDVDCAMRIIASSMAQGTVGDKRHEKAKEEEAEDETHDQV